VIVRTSHPQSAIIASKKVDKTYLPCERRTCRTENDIGHPTMECKENHVFDMSRVPDMGPEDAWSAIQAADDEKDLDDLKAVCRSMTILRTYIDQNKGYQGVLQGGTGHDVRRARTCVPY